MAKKELKLNRDGQGFIRIENPKPKARIRKIPVLQGGRAADGATTLATLNKEALCRNSFRILVNGLLADDLNRESTRPELYAHLTIRGNLKPWDYKTTEGKHLRHIYKNIEGRPIMPGNEVSKHSAFSSMVMAFVASDAFRKVWRLALQSSRELKGAGMQKMSDSQFGEHSGRISFY